MAKLDFNRALENPKTSGFTRWMLIAVLVTAACVIFILIFNSAHNKISTDGIETNIPKDSPAGDTAPKTIFNIRGDFVQGDKYVNAKGDSNIQSRR